MILKKLGEFAFRFNCSLRLILGECVPMCLIGVEKERQEIKQIFVRCQSTVVRTRISIKLLGTEDCGSPSPCSCECVALLSSLTSYAIST